jgi:7-cyano-7-deazaguanine synthase in queuosine biosynthesis
MNKIEVQLEPGNPYNSGSAVYLDIDDGRRPQLGFNIQDYTRTRGLFDECIAEFAYFTSVIYGCDRALKRDIPKGDRWTREFVVKIPVTDPEKWTDTAHLAESMLEFLTGDLWHLDFVNMSTALFGHEFRVTRRKFRKINRISGTAVSLFSGGLDSLIGIIDWLEENSNANIVLASTYDAQAENSRVDQERVIEHLRTSYPGRIKRYVARIGLCTDGEDTNFRSRSLAFIGNALLAAGFLDNNTPIMIPENGAIALNFPLTPAREGSLSTRTAHPKFLSLLNEYLDALGFDFKIRNPYRLKTKGQMMQGCKNQDLLRTIYSESVSCGKRGFDRQYWSDKHARGCGACVPCIFRRAAILEAAFAEERYGYDLRNHNSWQRDILQANGDLQAVMDFIESNHSPQEIWKVLRGDTRLDLNLKNEYVSLVQRLREEVKKWLQNIGIL